MNKTLIYTMLLALTGCAANSQVQRADHSGFPIAGSMDMEIRITQHQMVVSHANSTAGGMAGIQLAGSPSMAGAGFAGGAAAGLIGALVDVAIDAHRSSVAEDAAKPILENMKGLDVDDIVFQSVHTLDPHLFAGSLVEQRLTLSEEDELKNRHLPAASHVLVIAPAYSVSYDGTTFTYVLAAKIVDRGMNRNGWIVSTPRYQRRFQYIVTQESLANGARWGTLSSEQWKTLIADAANETVAMLNYDFNAAPDANITKMKYGKITVSAYQTKADRTWAQTNFGMISVASSSLAANSK